MKRSAFFLALAMPAIPMPAVAHLWQAPETESKSNESDFRKQDFSFGMRGAVRDAEEARSKCDIKGMEFALEMLKGYRDAGKKLVEDIKSGAAPPPYYGGAEIWYERAEEAVEKYEKLIPEWIEECRKKAQPSQPPQPPPPPKPPALQEMEDLYGEAMAAYGVHSQAAANCDQAGMRAQRAKLEIFMRDARARASKLRQKAASSGNPSRKALADRATAIEKAIELLWQQALATPPMNCPKTGVATTPGQQQQFPEQPEQQQQQEVTPPGYGMRFTPPDAESQQFLVRINYWRGDAGMTALTWDRDLALSAEARGVELAQTGLAHRRHTGPRPVGENLLQSRPGQRSIEQMIDVWGNEKRYFVPGIFPNISTTGDWSAAGHYSQMVWSGSQWVGCAVSTGGGYDWTICHFFPVGNKDGKAVLGPPPRNLIPFIRPTIINPPESD